MLIKWCGLTKIVSLIFATIRCSHKISASSISVCTGGHLCLKKHKGLKKCSWHFKIQRPYLPWSPQPSVIWPLLTCVQLPPPPPLHYTSATLASFLFPKLAKLVLFSVFISLSTAWNTSLPALYISGQHYLYRQVFSDHLALDSLLCWLLSGWFALFYFLLFLSSEIKTFVFFSFFLVLFH